MNEMTSTSALEQLSELAARAKPIDDIPTVPTLHSLPQLLETKIAQNALIVDDIASAIFYAFARHYFTYHRHPTCAYICQTNVEITKHAITRLYPHLTQLTFPFLTTSGIICIPIYSEREMQADQNLYRAIKARFGTRLGPYMQDLIIPENILITLSK